MARGRYKLIKLIKPDSTACYMLSPLRQSVRPSVCLFVCPSVTRVDQSKTVEVRIMQFYLTVAPSL